MATEIDNKPTSPTSPSEESSGDAIQRPQPAHSIEAYETESDSSSLEATELRDISQDFEARQLPRLSHVLSPGRPMLHWYDPVKKFWRHQIRISVPHVDCRDHLANERTFLGYLRTSVALSMLGIIIAQLYRLQHRENPSKVFGYYVLSKPLSVIFQSAALAVILIGGIRYWRLQSAMAVGKMRSGGWEIVSIGVGSFLLLLMMFAVHLSLDIYKTEFDMP